MDARQLFLLLLGQPGTSSGGATSLSVRGPSSGQVFQHSDPFTVTPDGSWVGAYVPSFSGPGSVSPEFLSWNGDAVPRSFTVTPVAPGSFEVSGVPYPALASGGPLPFTALGSTQSATNLGALLLATVEFLRTNELLSGSNALVSLDPEFYPKSGQYYVVVSPGDLQDQESMSTGGGRDVSVEEAVVRVLVYLRSFTDRSDEDETALVSEDEKAAVTALAHRVKDHMSFFWPQDPGGNALSIEPLRYRYTTVPVRNRKARQWVVCEVQFVTLVQTDYTDRM